MRTARPFRRRPEVEELEQRCLLTEYFVAPVGNDGNPGNAAAPFATIQHALNVATTPGDIVSVRGGTYRERLVLPASGSAAGFITLQATPGERVILSGRGFRGGNMVLISNVNYVRLTGFEIAGLKRVRDGSGVRVVGFGDHIELRNNHIHDIRGRDAMGITVYGTSNTSISNLVIDGNVITRCDPARSEALTLNGNVNGFQVTNNFIANVNNIGIDLIGGEASIHPTEVTRNGVVRSNVVRRARSNYGGGFAAGIYVDGGRDIVIENNDVSRCDLGIEIGAENPGIVTTGITVRNNFIHRNDKAGLVVGGFSGRAGRVRDCTFTGNVVLRNDTQDDGEGQLWLQFVENCTFTQNTFVASQNNVLLFSERGSIGNVLDFNTYSAPGGPNDVSFTLNGREFTTFNRYRAQTGLDLNSVFVG